MRKHKQSKHKAFPLLAISPRMQASWRGEAVRAVREGLTEAPWSTSSLTLSMLPAAQAWQRGVLPWMVRTSTCTQFSMANRVYTLDLQSWRSFCRVGCLLFIHFISQCFIPAIFSSIVGSMMICLCSFIVSHHCWEGYFGNVIGYRL